jgi:hypothetical protein
MGYRAGHAVKVLTDPGKKLRVVERLKQHRRDIVGAGEIGLALCSHEHGDVVIVGPFIAPVQERGEKCAPTVSHKACSVFKTTATACFHETYMYPEAPVIRMDFEAIFSSVRVWSRLVYRRTTVIELVQS